jgi:hypothetical protein
VAACRAARHGAGAGIAGGRAGGWAHHLWRTALAARRPLFVPAERADQAGARPLRCGLARAQGRRGAHAA